MAVAPGFAVAAQGGHAVETLDDAAQRQRSGMPAWRIFRSQGSSTEAVPSCSMIASGFCAISVWIWAIWRLSLRPASSAIGVPPRRLISSMAPW